MMRPLQTRRKMALRMVIWALAVVFASLLVYGLARAGHEDGPVAPSGGAQARIVVLEDRDPDDKSPPFEDGVRILDSHGKVINTLSGLNICQTVGGCRAVGASEDGRFFLVCENVADRLCACETATGRQDFYTTRVRVRNSASEPASPRGTNGSRPSR